jgi:hypothetical protein
LSNIFEKSTSEVDEVEYDTDEEDGVRVLQIQGGRGVFEKSTSHVDEVEYDTAEEEEESFFILQLLQQKEQIPPSQVLRQEGATGVPLFTKERIGCHDEGVVTKGWN